MGELVRLMDQAKRSGVLEQLLQSMVVSEVPSGSMNDATKRRKDVRDELVTHSGSEWDEVEHEIMRQRMLLQWIAKLAMRQKTIE